MRKLIPFGIIVIVLPEIIPFLAIKFPSILPSTFTTPEMTEKKRRASLTNRYELASKLEQGITLSNEVQPSDFLHPEKLEKVSKRFPNDFSFSLIDRKMLKFLCHYMDLGKLAPTFLLRLKLKKLLDEIRKDDKLIVKDGIDSLTEEELKEATHIRGMRGEDCSVETLRKSLKDWIKVSLNPDVQEGLLFISRPIILRSQRTQIKLSN